MLKRLTTAGLVLAFLMTLVGTAVSGPDADYKVTTLNKQIPADPANQTLIPLGNTPLANRLTPAQIDAAATAHPHGGGTPAPNAVDTNACYLTDYYDNGTCFDFTYTRLGGSRTREAMRFDISPNHTATINGAYVWLYKANGAGVTPTHGVLEVWSDAGGVPGTLLARSVTLIPDGTVGAGAYVYFALSSPLTVSASNFHLAVMNDTTQPATDTLRFGSDDGGNTTVNVCASAVGTKRGSFWSVSGTGGVWKANTAAFAQPFDPNYDMVADYCEHYSSCYVLSSFTGNLAGRRIPSTAFSGGQLLNGCGQRFTTAGPETLKVVHLVHGSGPLFGLAPLSNYNAGSTNGYTIQVWHDSLGSIDISDGPQASVTVPGGLASLYPATGNAVAGFEDIPVPINVVVMGPFHVTVRSTTNSPANGQLLPFVNSTSNPQANGSVNFAPPDPNWSLFVNSLRWTTDIGGGVPQNRAFYFDLEMCKDEFSQCFNEVQYTPLGATNSLFAASSKYSQRVTGLAVNRVQKFRYQILDTVAPANLQLVLRGDTNRPATVLYTQSVGGPVVFYPGWNEVVVPGGFQVVGDFFAGIEGNGSSTRIVFNNDAPQNNGGGWFYSNGLARWRNLNELTSPGGNFLMEVEFCSIPFNERTCGPDGNWATRGHDFQRTSASGLALGDAYCDLNLDWKYEHPTQAMNVGSGPSIYNGKVACAFNNEYDIFKLANGALVDVLNSADNSAILNNIRCVPTIAKVKDTAGVDQTYMFIGGGAGNSVLCFDIDAAPASLVWVIRPSNGYLGHTAVGGMRYATFTLLTIGPDQVLYFGDDAGKVFAAYAKNGLPYTPFNGGGVSYTPYATGFPVGTSNSTDGTRLFFCGVPAAGNGDVTAINAANGTLAWKLSVAQGLKGATLYPAAGAGETFFMPVAVDLPNGKSYVNSQMAASLGSQFPMDGVFYTMDNAAGTAPLPARTSVRSQLVNIMIDQNAVYVPGLSNWSTPPLGGVLLGFNKVTNALNYATQATGATFVNGGFYQAEGVLTCEFGAPDLILIGDGGGYLGVFNADNGNLFYYRRIDYTFTFGGSNASRGSAIGNDTAGVTHYIMGAAFGTLFDFKKGADRSRLQIINASATKPVPFGSPADTIVDFGPMYWNAGCTPLTVSLKANTASNGTTPLAKKFDVTTVRDGVADAAASIANRLTDNGFSFKSDGLMLTSADLSTEAESNRDNLTPRVHGSRAALATPAYLNEQGVYVGNVFDPNTGSLTTAPGDTADIRVHVNGPLVFRGPSIFYVTFDVHNDPDYYLNDNSIDPEVTLTLVGGCLLDTTFLNFGAGSANTQIVWNMDRWADGDINPSHGFRIDGDNVTCFQGGYIYGVSKYRLAMNFDNWSGSGTDADDWISMQADPNFCSSDCKPALTSGVSLPAITTNGITYTPMTGNLVCKSYIDSVQNFDVGGGSWQWAFGGAATAAAPFDNDSTIGLKADTRTIGVVSAPAAANVIVGGTTVNALNQGTIEVMKFTNRNATPVNNWKIWTMLDYDIGNDTAFVQESSSTAWSASTTANPVAWGMIKIPFGCGYNPMKNVYALNATQAQFTNSLTNPPYFDSAYVKYASQPYGTNGAHATVTGAADQEAHFTIDEHNFAGNASYEIAVVNFRVAGTGDARTFNYDAFAGMWNKFAGFGRGDVNNDGITNLSDIIYLADYINFAGKPGPIPFMHCGDVNTDNSVNLSDVTYLINYYFNYGPCAQGKFTF